MKRDNSLHIIFSLGKQSENPTKGAGNEKPETGTEHGSMFWADRSWVHGMWR